MPKCASIADKLAVVRSMKTKQSEHLQAIDLLNRGNPTAPPFVRPTLGSVLGQQLGQLDSPIPNFVLLDPCPEGNEFKEFKAGNWAGWLGARVRPGARSAASSRSPDIDARRGSVRSRSRSARGAAPVPQQEIRERAPERRRVVAERRLRARERA